MYPFATNLALNLSTFPLALILCLNVHLLPIICLSVGSFTNFHILLSINDLYSSCIAFFYSFPLIGCSTPSCRVCGLTGTVVIAILTIDSLSLLKPYLIGGLEVLFDLLSEDVSSILSLLLSIVIVLLSSLDDDDEL